MQLSRNLKKFFFILHNMNFLHFAEQLSAVQCAQFNKQLHCLLTHLNMFSSAI